MIFKRKKTTSASIFQKRLKRFKSVKRGYYSFIIMAVLYGLSFLNPLLVNNKALAVSYKGEMHFPAFGAFYDRAYFGQEGYGEADYRELKESLKGDTEGWVLMPFYPYSPYEHLLRDLKDRGLTVPSAPDRHNWLGTDNRGRDVFARLVYGFNISLTFGIVVTFFSYLIGISIGAVLGYFGGKVDLFGQRLIEIFSGIPFLYAIMLITAFLEPSFGLLIFLLVFLRGWIGQTYYIRGMFFKEKRKDYVAASLSMGAKNRRIMFKHILPNSLTPVITFAPFAIVGYIFTLVSLDYLGFGLAPPTPSWGELLGQGKEDITKWWLISSPLVAILGTLLTINFIGEGLREAFDPKVHSRLR